MVLRACFILIAFVSTSLSLFVNGQPPLCKKIVTLPCDEFRPGFCFGNPNCHWGIVGYWEDGGDPLNYILPIYGWVCGEPNEYEYAPSYDQWGFAILGEVGLAAITSLPSNCEWRRACAPNCTSTLDIAGNSVTYCESVGGPWSTNDSGYVSMTGWPGSCVFATP